MSAQTDSAEESPGAFDAGYVKLQEIPWRGHWLLEREVLRLTRPGDRVFEGGVSTGYFARRLVQAGRVVDGAELDELAAHQARSVCDRVWAGDLQTMPVEELAPAYEAFVFGDTLEHLPDPGALLTRLRPRLLPSGHLIASIPNVANWSVRLRLLLGRFNYTERGILDRTHLRFFTRRTVVELLTASGFEVIRLQATVPVPFVTNARVTRAAHLVGNLWPSLFAYTFVVTARPVQDRRQ